MGSMRVRLTSVVVGIASTLSLLVAPAALAQEGFPLDGTWRGQWVDENENRVTVVIIMKWDGRGVNGMINPGPNSIEFSSAALDAADWGVSIDAATPDGAQLSLRGTLTDIGSYNRRIVGTWAQGDVVSQIELVRE